MTLARLHAAQNAHALAEQALAQAEAELRRAQSAASASKLAGDGRTLAITSPITGRLTRVDARLGAYVLAGADLQRRGGAAGRLAMTQPAVSNALRRLRDTLGDELVRRQGQGLG